MMKTTLLQRMIRSAIFAGCCVVAVCCNPMYAIAVDTPPEYMTYQGFLVDGDGKVLATNAPTNFDVVFRIYDEQSGGTQLWSEQQTVTVDKGYFSVLLGEAGGGDLSPVFYGSDASSRFIGITVKGIGTGGADLNILPRLRLVTSPYAFLASHVPEGSITSAALADGAILSEDIQDGTVSGADITDDTIRTGDISDRTIRKEDIHFSTLTGSEIADGTLTGADIADNTLLGADIQDGTLTGADIQDGSVRGVDIQDGSLQTVDLSLTEGLVVHDLRTSGSANDCIAAWSYDNNRMLFHGVAREGGTWKTRFWVNPAGSGFLRYAWVHASDERLKEDIAPLENALDGVLQLKPSVFRMKDDPGHGQDIGLIAQDVLPVYPALVSTNGLDGSLGINYSAFGVIAVGAVQELHGMVKALEAENAELEARLAAFETRLQALDQSR